MIGWLLACGLAGVPLDLPSPPDLPSPLGPTAPARALGTDWQSLSPLLRVRPYDLSTLPDELAAQVSTGIGRAPDDRLRFVVVVDTPETVGVVGPATAAGWSRSEAEIYAVARAHTRATLQSDLKRHTQAFPSLSGGTIPGEMWTGGDTASVLTDLDSFLGPAPHGALLSVPSRELVMVHHLSPDHPLDAVLATFAALTVVGASPDQEPFSRLLYWWHADTLRTLTVEDPDPGRPRVVSSPTLDALQHSLQEAKE